MSSIGKHNKRIMRWKRTLPFALRITCKLVSRCGRKWLFVGCRVREAMEELHTRCVNAASELVVVEVGGGGQL